MLSEPITACPHYKATKEFVNCQPCVVGDEHPSGACCRVHCILCSVCNGTLTEDEASDLEATEALEKEVTRAE